MEYKVGANMIDRIHLGKFDVMPNAQCLFIYFIWYVREIVYNDMNVEWATVKVLNRYVFGKREAKLKGMPKIECFTIVNNNNNNNRKIMQMDEKSLVRAFYVLYYKAFWDLGLWNI